MDVFNSYVTYATQTINQPLFSVFTKNPSIIYVYQNLPTNTLDNYPSSTKFAPNGYGKLTLTI
jgi:hypothetical protein